MSNCKISVLDINQFRLQERERGSTNSDVLKVVVMLSDLQHMGDGTVKFTSPAAGDESQVDMGHDIHPSNRVVDRNYLR